MRSAVFERQEEGVRAILHEAKSRESNDNLSAQILTIDQLPDADENEFYRKLTELPFPPSLEPGMVLDGYRILREVHASNRTQIYLALDTETNSRGVMKLSLINI